MSTPKTRSKPSRMKAYEVTLKRTSYISETVEATSQEEAEQRVWDALAAGGLDDGGYGEWELEHITT